MIICRSCGAKCDDGTNFCNLCGSMLVKTQPQRQTNTNQQNQAYAQPNYNQSQTQRQATSQANMTVQRQTNTREKGFVNNGTTKQRQHQRPALQLPTDRSLIKLILLSIITLGIYGLATIYQISSEINIVASRYDGRKTMNYFAMIFLMTATVGIIGLVWGNNLAKRIGNELRRRNYDYSFGARDFWLWNVLGALILVGPFIYNHKLLKAMNMINASYNKYG